MFVYFLLVVLISAILLVQSEETTAPVNSKHENIIPISSELSLKIEKIKGRRLGVDDSKTVDPDKKCYCRGCASMSFQGEIKDRKFTICCVPGKDDKGEDTHVTNVCCKKVETVEEAANIGFALKYFLPKLGQ